MKPEDFQKLLRKNTNQIEKLFTNEIQDIVGIEAKNHFKKGFASSNQGFTDLYLEKWQARTTKYKTERQNNKPVLTKSGDLKDSIDYKKEPGVVIIFSDLPYAKVHNEGGHAGRGKGFEMTKREFIGRSRALNERILKKCDGLIKKILKP